MKQPHKLTRNQKEVVSSWDLDPADWQCAKETEFYLKLIHKETGQKKTIDNFKRKSRRA